MRACTSQRARERKRNRKRAREQVASVGRVGYSGRVPFALTALNQSATRRPFERLRLSASCVCFASLARTALRLRRRLRRLRLRRRRRARACNTHLERRDVFRASRQIEGETHARMHAHHTLIFLRVVLHTLARTQRHSHVCSGERECVQSARISRTFSGAPSISARVCACVSVKRCRRAHP